MNLKLDFIEIFSVFMTLFAIVDIVGNIPIILNLKKKMGDVHAGKATITAFFIMIFFLFAGEFILNILGVEIAQFALAGSIVIFFISLEMVLGISIFKEEKVNMVAIFPIAFPLLAGAGTLTTLLSLRSQFEIINIIAGIISIMVVVFIVLKYLSIIERLLGPSILFLLRKIFGVILLALAIKLFESNLGI